MTLICIASQKGSPGASAAALAVAAAYRPGEGRRKLLLEADLSGGALALRFRLPTEPGLVTLAAAARAGLTDDELWRHVRQLPGGLPAVVCPEGPDQVHSALAAAGPLLGRILAERRDLDVICDLGRLQPGSPAIDVAIEATALLMVARPTAEQLQPAARRMLALRPRIRNLGWLLVGERPHGPGEVEATFGFPVVGVLADDRRPVEAIEGGAVTRRVRRHPFVRSATTVAATLGTWLSPIASPAPVDEPEAPIDPLGEAIPVAAGPIARPAPPRGPTAADDTPGPPPRPDPGRRTARSPVSPGPTDGDRPAGRRSEIERPDVAGPVVESPVPPTPPRPPTVSARSGPTAPDPFVHDEDDVEWTGT